MASQQSRAMMASLGCMMPFSTIFSLVRLRIRLIVSQVIERSLLASSAFRSLYCLVELEDFWISSKTGKARREVSSTVLTYLLRIPRTCASTVMANAENPYFSASLTCDSVKAQSLEMYICIIRRPLPLTSATSAQDLVERVLSEYTILCFLATLAGMSYPYRWERAFMAQGAKPKGSASRCPKREVERSVVVKLVSMRGTIINRWKLVLFSFRVFSSQLPESIYSKASPGMILRAASRKSSAQTHNFSSFSCMDGCSINNNDDGGRTLFLLQIYWMSNKAVEQRGRTNQREYRTFTYGNRAYSDRPKRKGEAEMGTKTRAIPETLTYLLMKEKFEQIYKHIERISLKDEQIFVKVDRKETQSSKKDVEVEVPSLSVNSLQLENKGPLFESQPNTTLSKKTSMPNVVHSALQINTAGEGRTRMKGYSIKEQMRKSRYRKKMLEPLSVGKTNLSNDIKDYLSVEKISVREAEESALASRVKRLRQNVNSQPSDCNQDGMKLCQSEITLESPNPKRRRAENLIIRRAVGKFKAPFALYYYRDFMWKVAYSNQYLVEAVGEYDGKLKYFVGQGNNSNLIKGIMKRRPWFQLTDKHQDANFVWTQIKIPSIFQTQKKGEPLPSLQPQSNKQTNQGFSLFNSRENSKWKEYWSRNMDKERIIKQSMKLRSKLFGITEHSMSQTRTIHVHNHFCYNFLIGNKKALFQTMSDYYSRRGERVFDYLPLTFHIKNGIEDDQYLKFLQHYYAFARQNKVTKDSLHRHNAWIIKPGEFTNRGNGILVCLELSDIKAILRGKEKHGDGSYKTYILQKYIERPLLYRRRKFDLRHYIMLTCINGCVKGYWYRHGYVRTTSTEYSLSGTAGAVHLTNDAVQKTLPDYGRFEKGNKITYEDLDAYLKKGNPSFDFQKQIYPQMKATATSAIHASALSLDPQRRTNNFEVFGLDFMIDADYKVWLIQVNTNPCLETTCPVLSKIIPNFIEHAFQIAIDPLFPAPLGFEPAYPDYLGNLSEQNEFQLVFDERVDQTGALGRELLEGEVEEGEDVFDDDGEDFDG